MPVDVSVIIVTYNALDHVDACIEAVFGAGGAGVGLEVVVVDNLSTDATVEHVRTSWPAVRIVETGRNGGMAAGNNAGMLAASIESRAFLLLNSDAFLTPGALRSLVDALDQEQGDQKQGAGSGTVGVRDDASASVAAVVPALRNVDGSPQRSVRGWPTPWRYATELWYLRRMAPRSRALNAFYGGGLDLTARRTIDWATGACLLVPRAAVDAVGLMDESYFMYGEEVDWLRRMARAGRRVIWEPAAVATHIGGGSAARSWGRLYQVQLENHVRYMARAEGAGAARRTQRILEAALHLRALLTRVAAAFSSGRARERRIERAAAFATGADTVAAIDPRDVGEPIVPAWPTLQRPPVSGR